MTALQRHEEPAHDLVTQRASDPFLAMIANAASRPETIPAIRELNELRVAEIERQARVAYSADFAQMQPKLPTISREGRIEIRKKDAKTGERDGDVQQSSPYAYWADILEACSPHMLEHGFGISFRQKAADDGKIIITGILEHRDGHREENSIALIHEGSGSKNPVQAIGSSLSYGMRYMGIMLLGVASKEHDDNKGSPEGPQYITEDQVRELEILIGQTQSDAAQFAKWCKVETLETMPREKFKTAKDRLIAKRDEQMAPAK
jgi:hypothetical protein